MSGPVRQLAKALKLGPAIRSVRNNVESSLFHALNLLRRSFGDRQELRINGQPVIYDVFPCKDNEYIAFTAYYGRLNHLEPITCTFQSGVVSNVEWIDDYPDPHEGEQILIGLFPIPEADKQAGATSICLKSANRVLVEGLTVNLSEDQTRHKLSVVTMMKDEDRYLREWIEYYRLLGAGHFYIYDNRSLRRNRIRKLLSPYVLQGVVTLVDWDYPYAVDALNTWRFCQRGQMHHCLYKYGHLSNWMLFIDVDEFVYPVDTTQMSLLPLLDSYSRDPAAAALQFKMMWFGHSGHKQIPQGLVIENYTRRATEIVRNGREKCCVKPDKVKLLYIHGVKHCIDGSRQATVAPEQYRINHYHATSSSRRRKTDDLHNEVEDKGMLRFVPQLHENLRDLP